MAKNAESQALADELENVQGEVPETPLLAAQKNFPTFPVDEYVPACIISYQVANIPVAKKFLKKGQPTIRPSVRFLFASHFRDENGNQIFKEDTDENGQTTVTPVILRKWTPWRTISYGDNAALRKLFKSVSNLETLLTADGLKRGKNGKQLGREDALWTTQFRIFCEWQNSEKKYSNITKVMIDDKSVDKKSELDINYSEEYIPYRTAPAYGNDIYLESAVCKLPDHIHYYSQDEMVDKEVEKAEQK